MTEPTRYAELAASLLRERPLRKESRLSRDVGISVVAHGIAMRRKRRGARLAAAGVGLAAAAALVVFGVVERTPGGSANGCRGADCAGAGKREFRRGLDAGQSIVAPAGAPTSFVLASGTQIALDAKSVLECRDATATQRFALLRGGAHLHVAKLRPNERFLVDTPQAEVEVRGTMFDVKIEPATRECAPRTLVAVREGRVEVRAEGKDVILVDGDHWTSTCVQPAEPAPAATLAETSAPERKRAPTRVGGTSNAGARPATAPNAATATAVGAAVPPASNALAASTEASALAEQNDLYAAAQAARRAGRSGEALATYARLLARFPRGQLAESATVERVRLLARTDAESAHVEAERYLARYPAGFARSEMQTLTRAP